MAHSWHAVGARQLGIWRAPTRQLARAKSSVGARQVVSWGANFSFGARQLPCWRTPNQDLARQLTTWRAPKPCPANACSFLRPLAALTLTPLALFRPPALGVKQVGGGGNGPHVAPLTLLPPLQLSQSVNAAEEEPVVRGRGVHLHKRAQRRQPMVAPPPSPAPLPGTGTPPPYSVPNPAKSPAPGTGG